jgi:hypothetical protein
MIKKAGFNKSEQKQTNQRRDPEIRFGVPIWHHPYGSKMCIQEFSPENQILVISSSAAKVTIRKASSVYQDAKDWFVDWEVVYYKPYQEGVQGRSSFSDDDLMEAFGLYKESPEIFVGDQLIKQFGATAGDYGKYIRWKKFLNIPCPGTGHDGDPNVSIYLHEKIQNAVLRLLA